MHGKSFAGHQLFFPVLVAIAVAVFPLLLMATWSLSNFRDGQTERDERKQAASNLSQHIKYWEGGFSISKFSSELSLTEHAFLFSCSLSAA